MTKLMDYPKVTHQLVTTSRIYHCGKKPTTKEGFMTAECVEQYDPVANEFMTVKRMFNLDAVDHIVECNDRIQEMIHNAWESNHKQQLKMAEESGEEASSKEELEDIPSES